MSHLKSCHCCGLIQQLPPVTGVDAICVRCETSLESLWSRWTGNRVSAALALAALMLYVPAVTLPFLRIEQLGHAHESSLLVGMRTLFAEGHALVGTVVLVFSIVLPLVKLSALLVLTQSRWRLPHRHRALTYRVVEHLGRWGMLDVLLVAVLVAFIKLGGLVEFGAGPGLMTFTLFVLMSLMASATFDPYCLWDDGVLFAEDTNRQVVEATPGQPASASPVAESESIPVATTVTPRSRRTLGWIWLIPIASAGIVIWLIWSTLAARGRVITISFADGHGIQAGDELRYHGIDAGTVEQLRLSDDLSRIWVTVRLTPVSDALANEGARFWIVRPQADLTGIAGLETVVGSKYLAVIPGPVGTRRVDTFVGLETPPLPDLEHPGGLEIVLQTALGTGLRSGLGVYYRNIRIGGVIDTGLATDSSAVEVRAYIRPAYRHLIRQDTRFWNAGGVHIVGGLTELSVHIGTLESLIRGGIGVSVPPEPGEEVPAGHRFNLHARPEKEWLEWQPAIANTDTQTIAPLPRLIPATQIWTHDGFFRNSTRSRSGWLLPVKKGLLGPHDLLTVPEGAIEGSAKVDVDGQAVSLPASGEALGSAGRLVVLPDAGAGKGDAIPMRTISAPEDGFLGRGGTNEPLVISAARYGVAEDGNWPLDDALGLTASDHGTVVIAASDGAAIGMVVIDAGHALLCPLDADW